MRTTTRTRWTSPGTTLLACCFIALALGCKSRDDGGDEGEGQESRVEASEEGEMDQPFGTSADVDRAEVLWKEMEGYGDWEHYPGFEGWQEGASPHGSWLKYYVNATAAESPSEPKDGAIIVKENYAAKDAAELGPVTVMKKIEGYAPDTGDWFWVKYDAQGNVMENEKGMALAGRVAKGTNEGCIACHSNARGGDYLFAND